MISKKPNTSLKKKINFFFVFTSEMADLKLMMDNAIRLAAAFEIETLAYDMKERAIAKSSVAQEAANLIECHRPQLQENDSDYIRCCNAKTAILYELASRKKT